MKKYWPLILITLIGGFLRFFLLNRFPVSLNWDEVSHGYNAYTILLTGKDEWGRRLPDIFRAFGDFKLPVYIYLTVLPVWLFGLSAFSVRFVSALAGTLAIPALYFLIKELFPERKLLLGKFSVSFENLGAFILAFLPWHFFISRPALEANLSLTLSILGFYFLIKFFHQKSSLLPSVFFLGLSLHTYNTSRVFVPLLVIISFLIYRPSSKKIKNLKNIFAVLLAIIFSGLLLSQVFLGEGTARYEKLKILSPAAVFQIGEKRTGSSLPPLLAKLIYNRPAFLVSTVAKNYLGYYSPSFFTQTWGAQFQFAIPGRNLLTLPVFLFAFLGFISYLVRTKDDNSFKFLYAWLLLSPVAAALTIDPPQALRPNPMIPALVILACFGISRFIAIIPENKKTITVGLIALWFIYLVAIYHQDYYTNYAAKYSSSWQYGYSQVMDFVRLHKNEYEKIFITKRYGEPHIFYAFFNQIPPQKIQPGGDNIRFEKSDWYWTDKIDNVYFVNDWQIPITSVSSLPLESGDKVPTERSLLITSPEHIPVNAHVIETIDFLDGHPAFIITSIP